MQLYNQNNSKLPGAQIQARAGAGWRRAFLQHPAARDHNGLERLAPDLPRPLSPVVAKEGRELIVGLQLVARLRAKDERITKVQVERSHCGAI